MVHSRGSFWTESDLAYLIDVLEPTASDREQLLRAMREDPAFVEEMLSDGRLFADLVENPERVLSVSGRLFFSVLISRTRVDLAKQTFTFERDKRVSVVVFDSSEVVNLLSDLPVRRYLAEMLASFVRIDTTTLYVRVQQGVFRRIVVNDFDIESLIEYSRIVDEDQRFLSCKRIGDICLFLVGIFSDYLDAQRELPGAWFTAKSREELAECGRYYYKRALRNNGGVAKELKAAVSRLSEDFTIAAKPLVYLSSRYLGYVKRTIFLR